MDRRGTALLVAGIALLVVLTGCVQSTTEAPNATPNDANESVPNSTVNSSISDDLPSDGSGDATETSGEEGDDPFAGLLQDVEQARGGDAGSDASGGGSDGSSDGTNGADTTGSDGEADDASAVRPETNVTDDAEATTVDGVGSTAGQSGPVVIAVYRADRYEVRFPDNTTAYVRPVGVAPPPTEGDVLTGLYEGIDNLRKEKQCVRQWGERTMSHVEAELLGQEVELEYDDNVQNRKKWVGHQAYLVVDGTNFNKHLIEEGYARLFEEGFSRQFEFMQSEQAARSASKGLWQCGVNGGEAREGIPLAIAEIQQEAPQGSDQQNLNDEFVVLENTGDTPIDMSSWSLHSQESHSFTFPEEYVLEPGATVTIHSGNSFSFRSPSENAPHLYWGSISPIWDDDSGTVIVKDSSYNTVVSRSYP